MKSNFGRFRLRKKAWKAEPLLQSPRKNDARGGMRYLQPFRCLMEDPVSVPSTVSHVGLTKATSPAALQVNWTSDLLTS